MLEIEKNENLLKGIGKAVAHIALVEYFLGSFICTLDKNLSFEKIQNDYTLGGKIRKIKALKDKSLSELVPSLAELESLNQDRIILVHGIIGGRNGQYGIHHRGTDKPLIEELLEEITKKAEVILNKLRDIAWTKVKKNQ